MQLPTLDSGGGDSGSGIAPQPGRLTPLGDILEDAITYVCSFLYLEEVGRLDIAMCSKKLRCAFLRSISGDALADLKTERNEFRDRRPELPDREPLLTPELSEWLRRRGLALCGYNVDERLKGTFVGIFRNTKRLILPASIVNESETLTSFLSGSGHRLEEISVKDSDSAHSLLSLLQTLHRLNPRVSAIEIDSHYDPPSPINYSEVAQYIASHFTHLTKFRLPTTLNIIESSLADVETIWKACTNLQSFRCILDKDVDDGYNPAYMDFDDGHLALYYAFSSLPTVHAAFQRFGGSLVSLDWTADLAQILDGDLVHLMSMCSQLQQFEIHCASVTDEDLIRALSPLPHLTSISLSGCDKLTVQGVIELIKRCRLLRHLKLWYIDLSRNYTLDEDGNLALSNINSDALAHEGSVVSIDWSYTMVSDDDLALMMSMCSKLQQVKLDNARNVTDEGLIRSLSTLPHLTSISLSDCEKLTVAGLAELAKRCTLVRHFTVGKIYSTHHGNCKNQFEFDEGAITGKGDLYWPLVEVFTKRQRDTHKASGDSQL
jgi:hypothetical protein